MNASPPPAAPTLEDRLESHLDKLAMWQLMGSVGDSVSGPDKSRVDPKDERDWFQRFCEDIVEVW
jgi:hypothetical protein